jgi:uncharacterized protein YndB with AHSA1/START domain
MNKVICCSARLPCDAHRAFEMFASNERLKSWLTTEAAVEPAPGGKYELFWDPSNREHNSTIGCRVTAIEPDKFLSFEWKGPTQFEHFMNRADPLTHVVVFFISCSEEANACTDVYLVHSGWRSSPDWEEARQWFENAWNGAFERLREEASPGRQGGS